jgi:hypothetical protein
MDLKQVEEEEEDKSKSDYIGVSDASEFKDSLVIFDDTEKMPNVKVEKMLYQLVNKKATIRHYDFFLSDCLDDLNKQLQCTFY